MEASGADGLADAEARIDWYLEKIREGNAEIQKNADVATRRVGMIEDWEAGERLKIDRRNSYLVGQIGMLAPATVEETEAEYGKKSRSLPHGTFGFRRMPDRIEIDDPKAALNFALTHGLEITVKESVSKTVLKTYVKDTGDEGKGFHMVPGADEFYVKAGK